MSLPDSASAYREAVLSFVWRQWGQMGVSAAVVRPDPWIQDPEALLLFSLEVARREPRIFDEILDWLAENGPTLMRQRLTQLSRRDPDGPAAVLRASLDWATDGGPRSRPPAPRPSDEPLFVGPHTGLAALGEPAPAFLRHGLVRPPLIRSGKSTRPDLASPFNLAFRLRAIFGASSRAEALRFLLAREGAPASTAEVAMAAALSRYGVHLALEELATSGVIHKHARSPKALRWWVDDERWRAWLSLDETGVACWVDWPHVYRGLALLWRWLNADARMEESAYIHSSRARALMEQLRPLLVDRGLAWEPAEPARHRGEAYGEVFAQDVRRLAEALENGAAAQARA